MTLTNGSQDAPIDVDEDGNLVLQKGIRNADGKDLLTTTLGKLDNVENAVDVEDQDGPKELVKDGPVWKQQLYDMLRRPRMLGGQVVETREEYLLRVPEKMRYIGLGVILRNGDKNYRYEFRDGITDDDFKEQITMDMDIIIEDSFDGGVGKAFSADRGKELYNLVMFIDGGTL